MSSAPDPVAPANQHLSQRVATGSVWLVGIRWSSRLLSLVSMLVLARLLVPDDFGLIAIASSYIAILDGLTALNLNQALISLKDDRRVIYDTAFTLGLVRGALIALLMLATAPLVADIIGDERIRSVVFVLTLGPLLLGLQNPRFVEFQRRLVFSREALVEIIPILTSLIVTVTFALIYTSYWALVAGTITGVLVRVAIGYALIPYRPGLSFTETRTLISFASWLTGTSILRTIGTRFDRLWVGGVLGTATAGIYHLGNELANLPSTIGSPLNNALYPALAIISDNEARFRARALEIMSILAAIALPMSVGLALVAEEVVLIALGEAWRPAALVIQFITPILGFQIISNIADSIAMCRRETHRIFIRESIYVVIRVGFMVPAIFIAGFLGVVVARAISGFFLGLINLYFACTMLNMPLHAMPVAAWRSILATTLMAVALLTLGTSTEFQVMSLTAQLATKIFVGATVYIGILASLWLLSGRPAGAETRILSLGKSVAQQTLRRANA